MGILSFDLKKLIRAFDGKEMNFFVDEDGSRASDAKAREVIANYMKAGYQRIPMRMEKLPDARDYMSNQKSRIDRLRNQLKGIQQERIQWVRAHPMMPVPRKILLKIATLEAEIEEAENYLPRKLADEIDIETLDRKGIAKAMVKMHIAGDYLAETSSVLREKLEDLGLKDCSIFHLVKGLEEQSARFAAIVCHPEFAGLSDFISTDANLLDDIDIIVSRYLGENLTIAKDII